MLVLRTLTAEAWNRPPNQDSRTACQELTLVSKCQTAQAVSAADLTQDNATIEAVRI
jgi:hypothetical protein